MCTERTESHNVVKLALIVTYVTILSLSNATFEIFFSNTNKYTHHYEIT